MKIQQLIEMAQIRINYLNSQKSAVYATGDVTQLNILDTELLETQDTLTLLQGVVNNNG
jgi:hypothetical protein